MTWAAREGILSLFGIFIANAVSFLLADKSLPFSAEAIAGIVTITSAAVGISSARSYLEYRQYSQTSLATGQPMAPPAAPGVTSSSAPSTVPPG